MCIGLHNLSTYIAELKVYRFFSLFDFSSVLPSYGGWFSWTFSCSNQKLRETQILIVESIHLFVLFVYLSEVRHISPFPQTARTSLMPGILKTVGQNKAHPKPIKVHCSMSICWWLFNCDLTVFLLLDNHL